MTEKKTKDEAVTDEAILFPEVEIEGVTIKPWTFGKLFDVSESLDTILSKAERNGLIEKFEDGGGFISYTLIARLFTLASPEVLNIISITLDIEKEEIKSWDISKGIKIAMVIFKQNKETIVKNVINPLLKG